MTNERVGIGEFADALNKMLEQTAEGIGERLGTALKKISQDAVKSIKTKGSYKDRTGNYRKSFYVKLNKKSKSYTGYVLASRIPSRTHLLEKGHQTRNGEFTKKFPHWAETEKEVIEAVERAENEIVYGGNG